MKIVFPKDFGWGFATSAYQIEGHWNGDGKGESIWDRFSRTPGRIRDGSNADIACDFYHRYEEDIRLAAEAGVKWMRMSLSWTRLLPAGTGAVERRGITFYRNVFACLHSYGIKVNVTLYHWDLPQQLQHRGGWANRESVEWFRNYAEIAYREFGDLVDQWVTFNEPHVAAFSGNWTGRHAPGNQDFSLALRVAHHIMLAHGAAVKAFRKTGLTSEIGVVLNMNYCRPQDPGKEEDVWAATMRRYYQNELFAGPMLKGAYPQDFFGHLTSKGVILPDILDGDMELIHQELDFLGVNNYFMDHLVKDEKEWPLCNRVVMTGAPQTCMGWEIQPEGLYYLVKWVHETYHPKKIMITENGMAGNDYPDEEGAVRDPYRISYLKGYLYHLQRAMQEGVPVKGYFAWSLTDNFEWSAGFSRRFGLVYVDYRTQKRIPKESFYWFKEAIRSNGFDYPNREEKQ
jgi:beta-glucosidase